MYLPFGQLNEVAATATFVAPKSESYMKDYLLNFPEDYEEYAWDIEQKGWFSAATLKFSGAFG